MKDFLTFILSVLIIGTLLFSCLFLCVLSAFKKEIWSIIKFDDKENKNDK